MSHHLQPIYDVWGGNAEAMAADIEELGVTVRQWRNRGDIPSRAWPKIIKAAARRGRIFRLEDFLPADVKSDLPGHGDEPAAAAEAGPSPFAHGKAPAADPAPSSQRSAEATPHVPSSRICSATIAPTPLCAASAAPSIRRSSTGPREADAA